MEINTTHDNYVIRYSLTMLAIVQADIMFKMDLKHYTYTFYAQVIPLVEFVTDNWDGTR